MQALQILGGHWLATIVRPQLLALREFAEQFLQMCQNSQNHFYIVCGHLAVGVTCFYQGELITARNQLKEGLARYDPQDHNSMRAIFGQDPGVVCLCYSARTLWHLGYPEAALQKGHEAIALAQQVNDQYCLALATIHLTWVYKMRRELPNVEAYAASATDVSRQHEFPLWLTQGLVLSGWVLVEQGQHEQGLAQIQEALTTWKLFAEIEFPGLSTLLAEAFARVGNIDAGLAALAEGRAVMEKTEQRFFEAEIYRLYAELSLQKASQKSKIKSQKSKIPSPQHLIPSTQAQAEAEVCFLKAISIARQQHAKSLELRAVMSLVRLRQQQAAQSVSRDTQHETRNRLTEAHRMLSAIYNWFTEGFETADLQEAKALLEELSH